VEFVGRADDQVKIRGYRVEPGEVGRVLMGLAGVKEAVVLAQPLDSDPTRLQLVAYCSVAPDIQTEMLQQGLQQCLPDYMVPTQIVLLERLPLTANGKLDKRALPTPGALTRGYVAPLGEIEEKLATVWAEVLKLERVGSTDNFFELGGDSILSLQIIARAKRQGIRLTPKQLFEKQTVGQLAQVAKLIEDKKPASSAQDSPVAGSMPLSPIQSRFFELDIPQRHHWNQSVLLKSGMRIEPEPLLVSLHALVQHHDALRLRFSSPDGQWRADFRDQEGAELLWQSELSDISELEALANEAQASLSLDQGPLLRAVLLALPDGQQRLLLIIHHLVVDGVSWRVLLEDLQTAYGLAMQNNQPRLPARTSSLQSWAEHLHGYALGEALQVEQDYWLESLGGAIEELPRDNPEGNQSSRLAQSVTTRLDAELTHKLLKQAPSAYRTQINDLLLTALAQVLCQWSGQNSVLVQMEGHGREDLFEDLDLSRTVGWFSSLFPVRLTPWEDLQQSIKAIKEQLRAVPNKGVGYGILRYLGSESCRTKMSQLPEARITFNYLGQFDGSFSENDGALFMPAAESAGSSQSEEAPLGNWLSINGQVYGGELQLVWTFSQEVYRTETVERLAKTYEQTLAEIVTHCTDGGHRGVTPSDFPLAGLVQAQLDSLPVAAGDIEDIYPLSPMQEGLLVHTLLEPNSGIYLMQYCYQVDHAINHTLFEQAWTMVVQRHAVLRTSFCWDLGDQMLQIVHRDCRPDLRFLDWRDVLEVDYERRLVDELEAELHTGFDLAREVPFRLRLIQLADARYGFVFSNHHILLDAWCRMGVVDEFFKLYSALSEGCDSRLPIPCLYRDFIAWLQRQDCQASGLFWRQQLAGFERPTGLPYDHLVARDRGASLIGDCLVALSEAQSQRMVRTVQANQLTVNTLAQAAWALLLQRYSGDRDVLFGVTVAGRPVEFPEMQTTVGLFINSIPLRVRIPGAEANPIVRDWLQELLQYNLALREHEHIPLVDIQAQSEIGRGQPLFDSLFVFENAPIADSISESAGDMRVSAGSSRTHTNYPITVVVYPGSPLGLHLSYDQRYFEHATMERLLSDFRCLLLILMDGLELPFHELEWPRDTLVGMSETTGTEPLPDFLLQGYARLVEETMSHVPERVAASCLDERWTYESLDSNSHRLAQALQAKGIGVDSLVVVLAERGLPMLGMITGVLRAGGGYLALDPALPKQRLAEILALSGARMLVYGEAQKDLACTLLEQNPVQSLSWIQVQNDACTLLPLQLGLADASRQLGYAIFTSGSTGTPKGVMVEQGGMLNNQLSKIPCFGLNERDVIAQTASQNFDISVWQLLTAGLCGAQVDIVPDAIVKDPEALLEHVRQVGITILEVVPASIQGMLELPARELPSLRYLLTTGDAMAPELAARWLERYPHIPLVNAYGPAECSDDVALHWLTTEDCKGIRLPVGMATAHNRLHVLNDLLEPMPGRATGELYISGIGVGRGYMHDARRTAEAFVPDPFSTLGGRLYRTGDLVLRRDRDEVLEYVGRADYQVKIRGFRIELGEVESRLQKHEALREVAVVDADFPNGKQLVAYVTAADRSLIEATMEQHVLWEGLRDFLRAALPDYMVPAHFVLLEKLPLTGNGKLDRKALSQIEVGQFQQNFVAPRNELESKIAEIWGQVLKVDRVGLTDNFFELGGDSIASVRVVARIKDGLGLEVRLQDLMSLPRLMDFVEAIAESGTKRLIVKMNEYAGVAKPLFCLHPSYGTIYDYYPLAMALRNQAPVYGIACRSYTEGRWVEQSWSQVVDDYLREILSVDSKGPYLLLGWSLGGNLALEISNRLEGMGKRVMFVGWIDAPVVPQRGGDSREMLDVPEEDRSDAHTNLLNSFCLIFPQFASEIRDFSTTLEPSAPLADRMKALEQWIDSRLGDGMMSQLRSGLGEVDVQLVQEVSRGFNTLLDDFEFGAGRSEIISWWAGKGNYEANKEALECLAQERLRESIIVDAYHDEITNHPMFIGTLREALTRLAREPDDA
jgi:amino acid adenylation domain-containing protein/non-ribosomal peptide synthase protein (TIGR01720 family)